MQAAKSMDIREQVSAEEWQARVDLAALYRLTALYHWDDLVFTHISMRVPGPEHHFLINPYGFLFEEITADQRHGRRSSVAGDASQARPPRRVIQGVTPLLSRRSASAIA